jgi:hypothetical protein
MKEEEVDHQIHYSRSSSKINHIAAFVSPLTSRSSQQKSMKSPKKRADSSLVLSTTHFAVSSLHHAS